MVKCAGTCLDNPGKGTKTPLDDSTHRLLLCAEGQIGNKSWRAVKMPQGRELLKGAFFPFARHCLLCNFANNSQVGAFQYRFLFAGQTTALCQEMNLEPSRQAMRNFPETFGFRSAYIHFVALNCSLNKQKQSKYFTSKESESV